MFWRRRWLAWAGLAMMLAAPRFESSVWGQAWSIDPDETAQRVDAAVSASWGEDADPASTCDDATYLRRVWLDVAGEIPTSNEVIAFLEDDSPDKRRQLVEVLLDDPRYGLNWARYWRDVIFSRRLEDRALLGAAALETDLSQWLNEGEGWDAVATRFITASGDVRENGATALIFAQDGRTEEIAAEASRIFLGVQIQCAQCHDHPTDRWKRDQFHELAAFFPRLGIRAIRDADPRTFEVFSSDNRRMPKKTDNGRPVPEHWMPDLDDPTSPGTRMTPRFFLTSATLPIGVRDRERRAKLSEWLTSNPWFAKAVVNRMWSELAGEGFYEPIDDMGPDRIAHVPEALEELATGFELSGYDLKWLVRTICATEAYARTSRPRRTSDAHAFLANVAQPLRADQLFHAVRSSLGVMEPRMRDGAKGKRREGARMQFHRTFGFDPSDPRETATASIPQTLALMNGPVLQGALRADRRSPLGRLYAQYADLEEFTKELYLRTVSRLPTRDEIEAIDSYFKFAPSEQEAVEDLAWTLLNSAEFRYRN